MKKKLFTLSPGERYRIKENNFSVTGYKNKVLPRIGRTTILESLDSENKKACFTRNFEVNV